MENTILVKAHSNGYYSFDLNHHRDYTTKNDIKVRGLKQLKEFLTKRGLKPDFRDYDFFGTLLEKYNKL